jgi:hypothetical protein
MGNNRRKKQIPSQNHTGGRSNTSSSGSFKLQDELAASSLSSESTNEKKEATLKIATLSKNNNRNNGGVTIPSIDSASHGSNGRSTHYAKDDLLTSEADDMDRSLLFSWKEILTLCFILLCFAGCSIIVGVAAGVSISIHYYESPENVDHRRLSPQWDEGVTPSATQHVTRLDPTIASSLSTARAPYSYPQDAVPLRVIHTSNTGFRSVLYLVEESPSLQNDNVFHQTASNSTHGLNSDHGGLYHRPSVDVTPPHWDMELEDWLLHPPKLCSDSRTMGYKSWSSLRLALQDANRYSAHRFEQWLHYFSEVAQQEEAATARSTDGGGGSPHTSKLPFFHDEHLYYEEQFVFTICPGVTLKAGWEPLLIDTESVTLKCDGCTITGGTSHISFGPDAKNAHIRGIRFQSSSRSSVLFPHNGADAVFEDCTWVLPYRKLKGARPSIISGLPAIAQVNSSSTLKFYRCYAERPQLSYSLLPAWPFRKPVDF